MKTALRIAAVLFAFQGLIIGSLPASSEVRIVDGKGRR